MAGDLQITPWKCPFCVGGIEPSKNGQGRDRCLHCTGTGLTDQPCGPAEGAPRPPGVMRTPCADCAYRQGSPELDANGAQLPDDEPFYCHQGLPVSAFGAYTPTAMFRGLPLGAMVCAGRWAFKTGEPLPDKPYREVPVTEDQVDKRWGPTKPETLADEPMFGVPGCDCRPFTRQEKPPRYLDQPGDTVDMISGWEIGPTCPHHRQRTEPTL